MYVLRLKGGRCEHDRYYVGSTKDPQKRIADHLSGKGAKVTKRHPSDSIELESIKQMSSGASARKEETAVYLELKNKHGKDKVRGAVCRSCSVTIVAACKVDSKVFLTCQRPLTGQHEGLSRRKP